MNHHLTYNLLILRAKERKSVEGYFEVHHIIPKSLGGTNDQSNLVKLTAREHFIAHCLLARIHGGTQWYSILRMRNKDKYFNSRLYETAKSNWGKVASERYKGWKAPHVSEANRKRKQSVETRAKISLTSKGVNNPMYGKPSANRNKPMSAEQKIKISEAHKNKFGLEQNAVKRFTFGYL